jgi:hypothetical protein
MVPSDVMVGRAKQHQDRQQNEQQFGKKAAAGPAALFSVWLNVIWVPDG